MKTTTKMMLTALATLGIVTFTGCSGVGDTYTTVEPTPVEVVIINGEEEPLPTELFDGVRAAYNLQEGILKTEVRMLDNEGIDLFNFIFIIEYEDGDVFYSEPNAERENGSIAVRDEIALKKVGRYTISLFYYGDDDYQLTKHAFEVE